MAKEIIGTVLSNKADKTIVITEHVRYTHPLYRKQYTVTKKFIAHDEANEAKVGDKVAIVETRPISARKHFKLDRILSKAQVKHVEPEVEIVAEPKPKEETKATKKVKEK